MTKQFFDELNQWQCSFESRRSVTIQFGSPTDQNHESVYIYDYDLQEGAFVDNVNDLLALDLKAKRLQSLHEELSKLETPHLKIAA
jgi:hypothetical protein